jgi:predicted nucleotidyltransferase
MWLKHPLDDVLSSRAKVDLLRVLCASPVPLAGREVARRARLSPGHASRALRELVASGVLQAREMGQVRAYELDHADTALVRQLRALFSVEVQRQYDVADELLAATPGIVSIVLFGSEARSDAEPGSDTDLLIVVEESSRRAEKAISARATEVAERHGLALSWQVADLAQLRRWDRTSNPLWQNLLAEGVRLRGRSLKALRDEWQRGKTA